MSQLFRFAGGRVVSIESTAGSTDHFSDSFDNGDVDTIPASAGAIITLAFVQSTNNKDLEVSFDGGTNYSTVPRKTSLTWAPKGDITQIKLRGLKNNTDYEVILNRKA